MAITNAEMADAWGDLLGLTPEKVTELAALLDQWALGGARLATWSRLATDVNLFNNAATVMVFDWYGGNASGGPNGDGLYPLMNSEGEVALVPSPAKIMAGVSGLDPKGTLASEAELPPTGAQGDLWVIDGDAYVWSMSAGTWVNMGAFQGPQGPAVELRTTATHVQWRVVGASTWINIIALVDLKGADGQQIELRTSATHVQWRLGTGTWTDLIALSALKGADGREIQMQKSATHIQWRYVGDAGWTDLVPLADITPPAVPGPAAWTPVLAGVVDGERRVQQIVDWVGGGGTKPATGKFIGPTGPVDTAAEATNWRGAGGSGSGDMIAANNLSDLTDDAAARTNLDVYSKGQVDTAIAGCATDGELSLLQDDVDDLAAAVSALPPLRAQATVAQVRAGKNTTTDVSPAAAAGAMAMTALTDAATVAIDLDTGPNFTLTTTAGVGVGRTLGLPTNGNPGQYYTFRVTAHAGATVAYHTAFKWPKGSAKPIANTAGAITEIAVKMIDATRFDVVGFVEDIK